MSTSTILWLAIVTAGPSTDGPAAEGEVSVGLDGAEGQATKADKPAKTKKAKDRGEQKWIRRWAPERNMGELGVFGGVMFPHPRLELFEPSFDLPDQGFVPLRRIAPEGGARVGYYPARIFGMEAEGAVLPTATTNDDFVLMWGVRGQLVLQLPFWSVTPFVLAGASGLGVSSGREAVGNDLDLGFHYGVGLKIFFNRWVGMRLDLRDTLTARRGVGESVSHSPEALLGLMITLGRKRSKPPAGPIDTDGDGIFDPDDECVEVPGVAEYDGCPIPDTDGDGILDPDDQCVDVPGVEAYQGCPIPDTDGDGILDPDDQCVDVPENDNGYQDDDGCPDEIPKKVKIFTGVIEGIFFDTGKATIKPKSIPKLDKALALLKEYPDIRIEVSGHTDDRGDDALNLRLSLKRADAVKTYFTDRGIDPSRIETRGAGEDEPIASNNKKQGRAKNRRIEFKLLGRK